jgi:long-subunit fatty acid transport protein
MKKLLFYLFISNILLINTIKAQIIEQSGKLKNEIEFSTNNFNFNNSSIAYSQNFNENLWIRLGLINISGKFHKYEPAIAYNYNESKFTCGLMFGLEKHKSISTKLEFVYGLNIQMTYNYQNQHTDNPSLPTNSRDNNYKTFTPGIGGILGFYYKLNDFICIGADLNPVFSYFYEKDYNYSTIPNKNSGFDFSLSNFNPMLTARFSY